jgi:hypothetical protein
VPHARRPGVGYLGAADPAPAPARAQRRAVAARAGQAICVDRSTRSPR